MSVCARSFLRVLSWLVLQLGKLGSLPDRHGPLLLTGLQKLHQLLRRELLEEYLHQVLVVAVVGAEVQLKLVQVVAPRFVLLAQSLASTGYLEVRQHLQNLVHLRVYRLHVHVLDSLYLRLVRWQVKFVRLITYAHLPRIMAILSHCGYKIYYFY